MLFDYLRKTWTWIISLLSGAEAVQVTAPQPEPVSRKFEKTIYLIVGGGEERWQDSTEGGSVIAKMQYNSDGSGRLTMTAVNIAKLHSVIASATMQIADEIGTYPVIIGEIDWVEIISN